jgi:3-isopropylmalate dehydratase small subunit
MSEATISLDRIEGPAFVLGDDINTDLNCSAKYLPGKDNAYIAAHAFEAVSPGFASRFKPGGILVAGRHFGINSSREQAVHVMRTMGVAAIVARSFGRQFYRNAINNGLLVVECDTQGLAEGELLRLDLDGRRLQVPARGTEQPLPEIPAVVRTLLQEGGLIAFLKKHPDWQLPGLAA